MDAPQGSASDFLAEAAAAAQSVLRVSEPGGGSGSAATSREGSPTLRASSGVLRAAFHFDDDVPSPAALAAAAGSAPRSPHASSLVVSPLAASPGARRALALTRADSLDHDAPQQADDEWLKRSESAGSREGAADAAQAHAHADAPADASAHASPPDTPPPLHAPPPPPSPAQPAAPPEPHAPPQLALPRRAAPPLFPDGIPASYFMPAEHGSASSHASFAAIAAAAAAAVAALNTAPPSLSPSPSAPEGFAPLLHPLEASSLQPGRPPSVLPALAAAAATRRMEATAAAASAIAAVSASPRFATSQPGSPLHAHSVFDPQRKPRFELLAAPRPKPPPPLPPSAASSGGWDSSPLPPASPAAGRRTVASGGGMEPPGGRNRARAALASVRPAASQLRHGPGPASPLPRAEHAAAAAAALLRGGRAFANGATASAPGSALPSPPQSPRGSNGDGGDSGGPARSFGRRLSGSSGRAVRRVSSMGAGMAQESPPRAPRSPGHQSSGTGGMMTAPTHRRNLSGGRPAPSSLRGAATAPPRLPAAGTPRAVRRYASPPPPEARPAESLSQLSDALMDGGAAGDEWLAAVAAESAAAAARAGLLRLSDCDTSAFAEALRDATAAVQAAAAAAEGALATSALHPPSPGTQQQQQQQAQQQPKSMLAQARSFASHVVAAALGALLAAAAAAMAPQLGRSLAAAWETLLRKAAAAAAA